MDIENKLYLVNSGLISSIGHGAATNAAMVRADVSGFQMSDFVNQKQAPITMATVPHEIFDNFETELDMGTSHSELMDREIKMAILAAQDALDQQSLENPIPLILAIPEEVPYVSHCPARKMLRNLSKYHDKIDPQQFRSIHTGRAGGLQTLELAQRYLYDLRLDYVLVGGSDSYYSYPLLNFLNEKNRPQAHSVMDGFVPGEAASFLLLTRHPSLAAVHNGYATVIHSLAEAEELGHLYSEEPYRGDGLSNAIRQTLATYQGPKIKAIYSSMNGENHWAKEYGVASLRNKAHLHEDITIKHPADCWGDIGVATGLALIVLAADDMKKRPRSDTSLVYCSSDSAWRASCLVENVAIGQE